MTKGQGKILVIGSLLLFCALSILNLVFEMFLIEVMAHFIIHFVLSLFIHIKFLESIISA